MSIIKGSMVKDGAYKGCSIKMSNDGKAYIKTDDRRVFLTSDNLSQYPEEVQRKDKTIGWSPARFFTITLLLETARKAIFV